MVAPASDRGPADRFQVLALDGGGILGIFSAALLAGLEKDMGRSVLDHFDLVVGTSTGGIIALALGAGLPPADIVDLYVSRKDTIFPRSQRLNPIRRIFRPKYSPDGLEQILRGAFGDLLLGESIVPLVIPSFDLGENRVYLFKTPHHEELRRDHTVAMWQVAMATTAAPTYFPAYSMPDDHTRLVDGGVWANNPAPVGVAEAVSVFGQPLDTIRLLSIGTTVNTRTRQRSLDNAGLYQWVRSPNAASILITGQAVGAFTLVEHLLGADRAVRLDPPAPASVARLDHADARDLIAKASHHSRAFSPTFERIFSGHTAGEYRPFYGPVSESR
jgi:patatin-like phospholipase/acyl hydrolase